MINQKRILELCQKMGPDGRPFFRMLHSTYLAESRILFQSTDDLVGDFKALRERYTLLATSAGAVGATQVSIEAAKLVNLASTDDSSQVKKIIEGIEDIFEKSEEQIAVFIKERGLTHTREI